MNRQEKRRIQRLEGWLNSLPKDKLTIIEQAIQNRTDKKIWLINQVIDTSIAAALSDLQDLSIKEIEEVLKLSNEYLKDSEEFLRKNGENWIMELKKVEKDIKARIKEMLDKGIVKSKGLVELKKEFKGIPTKDLSNFWLEVKEEYGIEVSTNTLKNPVKEDKTNKTEKMKIREPKKFEILKKVTTLKGEFDVYQKEGTHVKTEKFEFNNADEIEKCREKLIAEEEAIRERKKKEADEEFSRKKAEIFARLNEYMDVMLMEV